MSHKKKALFQKDMPEKRCGVVKIYWWHGKIIIEKIVMSHNAKYCLKSDIATVDFSCASLSSKSKKGNFIEVDKLIVFFWVNCFC